MDVPPHVAGVRRGMCVTMWMAGVQEHVSQGTIGTSVTRVIVNLYTFLTQIISAVSKWDCIVSTEEGTLFGHLPGDCYHGWEAS